MKREYFKNMNELDLELRILELKHELFKEKVNLELAKLKRDAAPSNIARNFLMSSAAKLPSYLFSGKKRK